MGIIGNILSMGAKPLADAATTVIGAIKPNAEAQSSRLNQYNISVANQFAQEFRQIENRTKWDSFVDGLNRLPRPIIVFGVVGLFVYAMVSPDGFIERMKAIAFIPESLWVIFWTILPVYFGLREVDKTRKAANRTTMLKEIADIEKSRSPKEVVDGNAALQDWQSEQ